MEFVVFALVLIAFLAPLAMIVAGIALAANAAVSIKKTLGK